MATVALPGQVIGSTSSHIAGSGTHVYEAKIHASVVGSIITIPAASKSTRPTLSVSREGSTSQSLSSPSSSKLPTVGSTVLGRVLRVQQRQLIIAILIVDPSSRANITPYTTVTNDEVQPQAILRKEDVRAHEKDKVVMNEMFRVGDIVRATVISLGDERNYYISTAGNEFGVVVARSEGGNAMVPVSWKEMRDVVSGKGESRKVAKPS